jgi:lysophospholipase L1-like esterase
MPDWHDSPENGIRVWPRDSLRTLVCLGDSLMRNQEMASETQFPARLQERIDHPDSGLKERWRVVNAGKHGDPSINGVKRWKKMIARNSRAPDILVIALGANDFFAHHGLAHLEINLQKIIKLTLEWNEQARIIVASMAIPVDTGKQLRADLDAYCHNKFPDLPSPSFAPDNLTRFGNAYKAVAENNPRVEVTPYILEGITGNPELSRDVIHANEAGIEVVTSRIYNAFEPIARGLEKRPGLDDLFARSEVSLDAPQPPRLLSRQH